MAVRSQQLLVLAVVSLFVFNFILFFSFASQVPTLFTMLQICWCVCVCVCACVYLCVCRYTIHTCSYTMNQITTTY